MNNNTLENTIASDPIRGNKFINFLIYPYITIGLITLFVSGYIEFLFFTGIFTTLYWTSLCLVLALEGAKIFTIVFYRFFELQKSMDVPNVFKQLGWTTRTMLILFSVICSFAKVAEFMDNPNFSKVWETEKRLIEDNYSEIFQKEDSILISQINIAKKDLDDFTQKYNYRIRKQWQKEQQKLLQEKYELRLKERESKVSVFRAEKDKILAEKRIAVLASPSSQNSMVAGLYVTVKRLGFQPDISKFSAVFICVIAIFVTLLLEFIIMTIFNYCTLIFKEVWESKLVTYRTASQIADQAQIEHLAEEAQNIKVTQKIVNTANRAMAKISDFVRSNHLRSN